MTEVTEYVSFNIYNDEHQAAYVSFDRETGDKVLRNVIIDFDEHGNLTLTGERVDKHNYKFPWYADSTYSVHKSRKSFYDKYHHALNDDDPRIREDTYTTGSLWWKETITYKYIASGVPIYIDSGEIVKYTFSNYVIKQFEDMT